MNTINIIIHFIETFITFGGLFLIGAIVTICALYHAFKSGGKA